MTMTRLAAAGISSCLLATILFDAGWAAAPWTIYQADTMEKVFRDRPFERQPVEKLTIEAARDEVEGVQLVLVAQEELRGVTLVRLRFADRPSRWWWRWLAPIPGGLVPDVEPGSVQSFSTVAF